MSSGGEEAAVVTRFTKELSDVSTPGKPNKVCSDRAHKSLCQRLSQRSLQDIAEVLNRIKNELVWTAALAQTEARQLVQTKYLF